LLATARTLRKDPRLNASLRDGSRVQHDRIHLGVAVALDDGLFTVVLPDADTMRLSEIASEVSSRATRAREGRLAATDVAVGSTFTVSNLGMYGVGTFTAVINPPEVAILAVGAVAPAPVVMDGDVAVRSLMTPTLSIDHRVVDGAVGAEFLAALKEALEDPIGLLV
jgi:pyruvate dehydrogenase E2 component (dihydrolipoamide acetyltransferase)